MNRKHSRARSCDIDLIPKPEYVLLHVIENSPYYEKAILTDALGSDHSLKSLVAAILRTDTYIRWELVSVAPCCPVPIPSLCFVAACGRVKVSGEGSCK